MLIVVLFTFISTVLSNIFIDFVLCVINNFYNFIPDMLRIDLILTNFMIISFNAVASTGMALIPLYFDMRKKSVPATIVSAILMVSVVCSNNGGYSLSSIIAIPISLKRCKLLLKDSLILRSPFVKIKLASLSLESL